MIQTYNRYLLKKGFAYYFAFAQLHRRLVSFLKKWIKKSAELFSTSICLCLTFSLMLTFGKKRRKNQSNSSALSYPFVCFANQVDENIKTKDGSGRRRKNVEPVSVNRKSNKVRQEIEKSSIFLFLIATNDPKNKQPIQHFFRDDILFRWSYYIRVCLFLFLFLF